MGARQQFGFRCRVCHIAVLAEGEQCIDGDWCGGPQCLWELLVGAVGSMVIFVDMGSGGVYPKWGSIAEEAREALTFSNIVRLARSARECSWGV